MVKMKFSEVYSDVLYSGRYDPKDVILHYESDGVMKEAKFSDIVEKINSLLVIKRKKYVSEFNFYEDVDIPIHRVKKITHNDRVLMDRTVKKDD